MDGPDSSGASDGAALVGSVLAHHGIKGMKWGVSKRSSSSRPNTSNPPSIDHLVAQTHQARIKAGGVKVLSNQELQQLVSRLNLEQQHRNLASQQPHKIDVGQDHVKRVLKVVKTLQEIHGVVNSPAGKAAQKLILK